MRILTLSADFPPHAWSGIAAAAAQTAAALAAAGCEVDVVTPVRDAEEVALRGLRVHALRGNSFPAEVKRPDCIHLHSLALSELALELRRRLGVPLLYTAHSILPRELRDAAHAEPWIRRQQAMFRACDHAIFLNAAERDDAVRDVASLAEHSSILANCFAPATLTDVDGAQQERALVVYAGRFCRNKGADVALHVMERLLGLHQEVRCVAAGRRSGQRELDAEVACLRRKYGERFESPGWLPPDDLQRLLQRAALLLVPSRYEPFGMIALEAMSAGCAVLAADIQGLGEVVRDGSGGMRVRGHDEAMWARAAEAALADDVLMAALQSSGPEYVERQFGPRAHGAALKALMEGVIAQSWQERFHVA